MSFDLVSHYRYVDVFMEAIGGRMVVELHDRYSSEASAVDDEERWPRSRGATFHSSN